MKALHAALRNLVHAAQGPLDRRLRHLAGHGEAMPAHEQQGDDESELHAAVMEELNHDGKPHGVEQSLHHGPVEKKVDPAHVSESHATAEPDSEEVVEGDVGPEPRPSPADVALTKRKRGVRF